MNNQKLKLYEVQIGDLKDSLTKSQADNLALQKKNRLCEIRIRELRRELLKTSEEKEKVILIHSLPD
jgi:hypothetical protein